MGDTKMSKFCINLAITLIVAISLGLLGCVKQDESVILTESIETNFLGYKTSSKAGYCMVWFEDKRVTSPEKIFLEEDSIVVCNGEAAEERSDGYYANFEYSSGATHVEVMVIRPKEGTVFTYYYPFNN